MTDFCDKPPKALRPFRWRQSATHKFELLKIVVTVIELSAEGENTLHFVGIIDRCIDNLE